jgi:hypothetical protein
MKGDWSWFTQLLEDLLRSFAEIVNRLPTMKRRRRMGITSSWRMNRGAET